ncbi:MAG: hypothetical protein M4579_006491 [Chaenotheca gracillima]|nr:MAG: hypothetical protein M4579_006491 [Chaenotheca gracillima]
MDALVSLPLLSYLVIPSFGSYSTSLNLLFFYMTWSTLVFSYKPVTLELVGTTFVRLMFYVLPSAGFLVFDSILPGLSANIKAQGKDGVPRELPWKSTVQVVGVALFNVLLGIALQAGIETLLTDVFMVRSALKASTTLPSPWKLGKDLLFGFVLREILYYYIHRYILHSSTRLAKLHGSWHHSNKVAYSFVAHYDHPIAWVLLRFIPTYAVAGIFRFHLLTYFLFLGIISYEECITFSGYSIIPSRLLGSIARRQDVHLKNGGKGNYSAWVVLDFVHGTSAGGDVGQDSSDDNADKEITSSTLLKSPRTGKTKKKGKSS